MSAVMNFCFAITDSFSGVLHDAASAITVSWPTYMLLLILVTAVVVAVVRGQTFALLKSRRVINQKGIELQHMAQRLGEMEYKNRSITDSLVYAKKIQEALIPSPSWFSRHYSDSFLFFMPRDIISGDFYYVSRRGTRTYTVAADCTGHGVPGALMSMLGLQTIDRLINSYESVTPAELLNLLSRDIESVFSRDSDERYAVKDGMEIAVCMTDTKSRILQFAGSFLPVYIVSDGKLTEIKGDKFIVGKKVPGEEYTNHERPLGDNDTIYLSSDGYSDQFGGTENKKFMLRRLRYLLVSIAKYGMDDQRTILRDNILSWMGDYEQVDDMMIIGFRP